MIPFKDAVKKMSKDPHAKFFFFFCEKGENNKPVMLADTRRIDPKKDEEVAEVVAKAKAKGTARGTMQVAGGILNLTPKGPGLNKAKLQNGAMVAAGNAKVFDFINSVVVGEEEEDTEQDYTPAAKELQKEQDASSQIEDKLAEDSAGRAKKKETEEQKLTKTIAQMQDMLVKESDPIKQKALSSLLEKKETELAKLTGKEAPERVDRSIDPEQHKLNEHGFALKSPSPEYKDEEKKMGWRAKPPNPPEQVLGERPEAFAKRQEEYQKILDETEKLRASEVTVTKHYSPEEREKAKVHVDDKGRLVDSSGQVMKSTGVGYVADSEAEMYQFKENVGRNTGKKVEHPTLGEVDQIETEHHTGPLAGGEISGAGGLRTNEQGLIKRITNKSGHYKPGVLQMIQTVESLLKSGALLDKEWTDSTGQPLTGTPLQIYDGAMTLQEKIMEELADKPGTDVSKHLETVDKAKKMLTKLGCGPSNRFSKAIVEFIDAKESMTGEQVVTSETKEKTVEEFLRTGAGYKGTAPPELAAQLKALKKQFKELCAANEKAGLTVQTDEETELLKQIEDLENTIKKYVKPELARGEMMKELLEATTQRKEEAESTAKEGVGVGPSDTEAEKMAQDLKQQAKGKLAFVDEVNAFQKKFGSLQDLANDTDKFEDILVKNSGLIPMILKQFNLPAEKLKKWMDKDPKLNFFELDEKIEFDGPFFDQLFKGHFEPS